jgi:hypothetical protein
MKMIIVSILVAATLFQQKCNKEKISRMCYKGRLEIKGLCGNSTIKLLEGTLDASKFEASWTDEQTSKTYTNVFALGSPCSFPATLKEGDEFYFTLDAPPQTCMVCQAYYPKPAKAIPIKVLDKPCPSP